MEEIVAKAAHNPAHLFRVVDRGFLREGYYADLVVVDLNRPYDVTPESLHYKCGWSPFEGVTFSSSIVVTVVNGDVVFRDGVVFDEPRGRALEFLAG